MGTEVAEGDIGDLWAGGDIEVVETAQMGKGDIADLRAASDVE